MAESDFLGCVIVQVGDYVDLVRQMAEAEAYRIAETSGDTDADTKLLMERCKRYLRRAGCNEAIVNEWFSWVEV